MKVYDEYSTIELTADEANWLKSPGTTPAEALQGDGGFNYSSFQSKLEHIAKELHHRNQITVLIYDGGDDSDTEIASFNENGLNFLDESYKPNGDGDGVAKLEVASKLTPQQRKRAENLVYTSADECRVSLDFVEDLDVLNEARRLANHHGYKTKVGHIDRRIRRLSKAGKNN